MFDSNLQIIRELKSFIEIVHNNPFLLQEFSMITDGFTRNRKLPFDKLVLLIAKLCKKSLSVELENFFEDLNIKTSCSASGFTQQRLKLDPFFYQVWNKLLCDCFYRYERKTVRRWKDYRLIAVDGSNISLINTPELASKFGGQSNQQGFFVQAKTFYCYDVLNELILHSQISPYRKSELSMAYSLIESFTNDMIAIYDRNFCNYKMVALHCWQENEIKFVIRANENRNFVKSFLRGKSSDKIIDLLPSIPAINELRKNGFIIDKNTTIKVRLIKVKLEKSTEVLITNLWKEDEHHKSEFKELYFKRWGIETNISFQKNVLQLESFSGLTSLSIKQDFYATTFIANLYAILIKKAQNKLDKSKSVKKYRMKVNRNKAVGKFKANLIQLFITKNPEIILQTLYEYCIRDSLPERKNRSFKRVRKNRQSNSKHKTFTNYKPTY